MPPTICKKLRAITEKGIKCQACRKADNKKNIQHELQSSWFAKSLTDSALAKDLVLSRDLNAVDYLTHSINALSFFPESLLDLAVGSPAPGSGAGTWWSLR